ncbi:peptidase inhibitor family I36 protein [Nonomuraea sp. NPDC050643]|uniref:peptidase inhibitor family I36 protein n=1 Tax=Nonomuraea sp. NPDC050643 TaxID=3155660 RepID=UPI00340AE949
MRTFGRTLTTATATMALGGTILAAPPVAAAGRDGVCDSGEFCYYFNSGNQGSVSDFTGSVADYGTRQPSCYDFKGPGNGKGQCVKNAAASAWNRTNVTVRVYYNSNHGGDYQDFPPGAKGNLNSTLKNQNASHAFNPSAPTSRADMSYALYQARGRLVVGFDGYKRISGRHEGIDFARGLRAEVHALVSGIVTNVRPGATGGRGLSTIAIYNAALDKTVIYLHTAPSPSLRPGRQVSRGQVIGVESWRGVSSSSNAHTHVEMRLGKKTLAAKSVNDPRLENPNPTSFWNSQGYNIR